MLLSVLFPLIQISPQYPWLAMECWYKNFVLKRSETILIHVSKTNLKCCASNKIDYLETALSS